MKQVIRNLMVLSLVLLVPAALFAQNGAIKGKVMDASSNEALVGANVVIAGTSLGSAAGMDGTYEIANVPPGSYTVKVSFMGYTEASQTVQVGANETVTVDFKLQEDVILGAEIAVLADRAKPRETPVAYTDVVKADMEMRLGSQDIPMVLNATPSVYSTMGGGGAGDARINVRGFNQRNVAIMINGVPVNDMENGWVYWSNWDGVGDATQSIQMQRGLTAVNLATASVGGVMNIITDPTALKSGVTFKQEYGDGMFLKSTLSANSGLIDGKYAVSALVVKKTGDGVIDKTWTDAWAYYFGAAYNVNENHRLELYAVGAPQRHGQNMYKQNIAAYSHSFAKDLSGFEQGALDKYKEASSGRLFNETWGPVSSSYKGKQAVGDDTFDRYSSTFISERENFYHKPQVNLNWYYNINPDLFLTTVAYYSGGIGGGTGTAGSLKWDYSQPSRFIDFDATIANNEASATGSAGILRNSRNNQYTFGAISKLSYKVNENLKTMVGLDWRTATIDHYYEVRDLLGGDYYVPASYYRSEFWGDKEMKLGLGDKFNYYNTNKVDWLGGFLQAEYSQPLYTVYGTVGYSAISYSYTDHFKAAKTNADGTPNLNSGEFKLDSDPIDGYQLKGGAMYRVTNDLEVFGNVGYVAKVPIFDNVIDDDNGVFSKDPVNEKFTSYEAGVNWTGLNRALTLKGSFYYTLWQDRALSKGIEKDDGNYDVIFITGLDQLHRGFEFEAAYQPLAMFRMDLAGSIGNWKQVSDAKGEYRDAGATVSYLVGIDGLKVGDAPQTQVALAGTVFPIKGMSAQLAYRYYADFWADWDPASRIVEGDATPDRTQSWKTPSYGLIDIHAYYTLPLNLQGVGFKLSAHIFNLLDELYISDAVDNSQYNSFDKDHDADDAEVYMGLPRTFNLGLTLTY
ncbi:TonB-dependent receptor [candidate division KSB1 bacterium]|nr:TonB-dependent receptor [candidate division KSB1 bacterium]